jgi:hypothetical protein
MDAQISMTLMRVKYIYIPYCVSIEADHDQSCCPWQRLLLHRRELTGSVSYRRAIYVAVDRQSTNYPPELRLIREELHTDSGLRRNRAGKIAELRSGIKENRRGVVRQA